MRRRKKVMHFLIGVLVYAENAEDAVSKAEGVFEGMCSDQGPFDYATVLDLSPSRHFEIREDKRTVLASSEDGKWMIARLMKATKSEFLRHLKIVRTFLNKNKKDEQIYLGKGKSGAWDVGMFRYFCQCVGRDAGPGIHLYDEDGSGILNPEDLDLEAMTKREKTEKTKLWVVTADAHS